MSITESFEDELQTFFKYELLPYPLSLFDANGMRKTQKSAIYDCFQCVNVEIDNTNTSYIIDGGYLLHRVVWDREEIFDVIFEKYVHYVHRHFGHDVIIVCSNCQGQSCSNVESNTTDEDAYDIDEEISDPSFFLEQSIEMQQQGEEVSEEEHITVEEFEDYFDDS
ncbi:hypothetical protein AVEN_74230-1 [Araneus ventricosus]|uniref:Uncharacterized protein n=1 Tax=Araneus ventricosus TaxID=182803 RepID=A0A4Y2EV87_ARAVE|nr:hypothetical protein AVEN_74230-1 [Araneus ventricosus]